MFGSALRDQVCLWGPGSQMHVCCCGSSFVPSAFVIRQFFASLVLSSTLRSVRVMAGWVDVCMLLPRRQWYFRRPLLLVASTTMLPRSLNGPRCVLNLVFALLVGNCSRVPTCSRSWCRRRPADTLTSPHETLLPSENTFSHSLPKGTLCQEKEK